MLLRQIFEPYLAQYAYLIGCQRSGEALVIDPLRDIDTYNAIAAENDLKITAVAETHIHADFVSGGREFAADPDIHLYLSAEGGRDWTYGWPGSRPNTHLLKDGDVFSIGKIRVEAVHTPGHTPEHLSFLITDLGGGADQPIALATGDFLFVGDVGRPDLLESAAGISGVMEPSARQLQESLATRLAPYSDFLQILPAHGAGSACGKSLGAVPTTTLGYERRFNPPLKLALKDQAAFVKDILSGQPEPPLYFATMKRVNRDGIAVTGGIPTAQRLDPHSFAELASQPNHTVLDARGEKLDFSAGHLPGSLFAPLHSPFFPAAAGSFIAEDEQILLVLENSEDYALAARQLYRIGLDHIVAWTLASDLAEANLLTSSFSKVDFPDFDPLAARQEGTIIDVRTSAEFATGHLEGALSFPYTRLRSKLAEIPAGKRLYVHCGAGNRSALASALLQRHGHDVVYIDGICADCERIAQKEGVIH
jgi:hydroxyacylglutathione hydrolase